MIAAVPKESLAVNPNKKNLWVISNKIDIIYGKALPRDHLISR